MRKDLGQASKWRFVAWAGLSVPLIFLAACTTLPAPKYSRHAFPKGEAFIGDAKRPYRTLGLVRAKVEFPTLDPARDEQELCNNYYNAAVQDLVKHARKAGGDGVINVMSVVFLEDGRAETHKTPECSDDGQEGQILAQGIAVKWLPEPSPSSSPTAYR